MMVCISATFFLACGLLAASAAILAALIVLTSRPGHAKTTKRGG